MTPSFKSLQMGFIRVIAPRIETPTKQQIAALQPYDLITLDRIFVASSMQEIDAAYSELCAEEVLGFDTESKPVFTKGVVSDGPHVVQFATPHKAYIFQLHRSECHQAVASLIESSSITKVGFG